MNENERKLLEIQRQEMEDCKDRLKTLEKLVDAQSKLIQKLVSNSSGCKDMHQIEVYVTQYLHNMGMPSSLKGFKYIREAVSIAISDCQVMDALIKELYPKVAKTFKTTPSRVERGIRHAIDVTWKRGKQEVLEDNFGCTISADRGKPTNKEFIAIILEKVKLHF